MLNNWVRYSTHELKIGNKKEHVYKDANNVGTWRWGTKIITNVDSYAGAVEKLIREVK